jgi:cytidylate kinase
LTVANARAPKFMRKLIIAIDGPVGSGKSTVARRVAELLGYTYLDSGAMYRALAWKALECGTPLDDEARLEALARATDIRLGPPPAEDVAAGYTCRASVDGRNVTAAIRSAEVGQAASRLAVLGRVRAPLVVQQQRAGAEGGVVMEGRDIGTVVFPNAELKIFLDASLEVRAERRWKEYQSKGDKRALDEIIEEVRGRDRRDRERTVSPLVRAADAVFVDDTAMEVEETARAIVLLARERENQSAGPTEGERK